MDTDVSHKYHVINEIHECPENVDTPESPQELCQNVCNHQSTIFDFVSSEYVCDSCGIVIRDTPDTLETNEYDFDNCLKIEHEFSNTSNDFTINGILSSKINKKNVDHLGKNVKDPASMNRLRNIDSLIAVRSERSLRKAMFTINACCDKLKLPLYIKNSASDIYKKGYNLEVIKGRSIKSCVIASITLACNNHQIYKNPKELIESIDEDDSKKFRSDIFVSQRRFVENITFTNKTMLEPEDKLPFIAAKVGISRRSVVKALDIHKLLKDKNKTIFIGRSPSATAVCMIYIATKYHNEFTDQEDLASAGDISIVTLRKRCYELVSLLKNMGVLLPAYFTKDDGDDKEFKLYYNGDLTQDVNKKTKIVKLEKRGRRRKLII